ncbi:bone morphogenetic protein 1-like isoform X2 [Pecten maximus]|uniref:bone morphogenetic protein 1-like isoform X2 n=1 Tax=Pecten maximus TaxID=6579 RepID=UPI001458512E|nr:bone morphogenetic protein 1-like isoform X2 [Pecten maximus]
MDCKNETLIATKTDKYLTSPGFPDEYPTNTICYWTIQALSKKHSLHLEFLFIDIEEGNNDCSYDYVEAYKKNKDGPKTTLFSICKRNQWDKISFNVSEKEVFLKFFSDGTDSRTGFLLRYSSAVPGFKTAKGKGAGPRSQVVTEKPSAVSHTTLASEITPVVPKLPEADRISLALPPCGMCCTYSGVDCFQDCTLCHRPPWDIFTNPDVMNFNFNLW